MKVLIYHERAHEYSSMLRERFPELDVTTAKDEETLSRHIADADILIAWRFPLDVLRRAKKLRWIQLTSAGAEHLLPASEDLRHMVVTNARGIHAELMADYVLGVMVMLQWDFPRLLRNQQVRRWSHQFTEPLAGKTLGIVGIGSVGREIARRASILGVNVVGVKRIPVPVAEINRVFGRDQLGTMLSLSDFVVLAVPATPETSGMIGEKEFYAMKRTAYVINIARGTVINESALVRALQERWIAGAALDVFENEPLPVESPLWAMENVIITPHVAGEPAAYARRVMEIFGRNLERWKTGGTLQNVIDFERGY